MKAPYKFTPKTITVGGREIVITRCSATEALDLERSLAVVVGGGIAGSISSADDVVAAIGATAKQLTHAELLRLMNLVFQHMTIDGEQFSDIDSVFCDRPRDIWEVFAAAVEHNLGPLVDWLQDEFKKRTLKKTPASQESNP